MPLLAELAELAQDIRSQACVPLHQSSDYEYTVEGEDNNNPPDFGHSTSLYQRHTELRHKIEQWSPRLAKNVSFNSTGNMLFHAHAHKAAALLYLYRLLCPPGISDEADHVALGMAHEVLMYLSTMSDQLKTALWPILVAATELMCDEDRKTAVHVFEDIHRQRKTITSLRTKNFCVERVWRARDEGSGWNWLDLASQHAGECLPI